jgi:hypothetical protein
MVQALNPNGLDAVAPAERSVLVGVVGFALAFVAFLFFMLLVVGG